MGRGCARGSQGSACGPTPFRSSCLIVLAACVCSAAIAQNAPVPEQPSPELEEVIVTGSRIPVPANVTATSPFQIVTKEDIAWSGYTDVTDVLNSLPQTTISAGNDLGNHSSPANSFGGVATADLRGLGPQRTIVLINGRRLGLGDPNTGNLSPAPDLDQIPVPLIERIEIVTGGASATYGSDAVAGVVNFIMQKNFQGIQIDGQYGLAQHEQQNSYIESRESAAGITPPTGGIVDGDKRDLSLVMGSDFADGAGNIAGYFVYHGQDGVPGSHRDFADCLAVSTNALNGVPTQPGVTCIGPPVSQFVTDAGNGAPYSVVGHQFVPYPASAMRFDPASYQYAQRQDTRHQAGLITALGHQRASEALCRDRIYG